MNLIKTILTYIVLFSTTVTFSFAEESIDIKEEIRFHLFVYDELSEYINDLFEQFSDGYIFPDQALKKVTVIRMEYKKKVSPVPDEAKALYDAVLHMLSRIENYFIFYKRANRENPEINFKLAQSRYKVAVEASNLKFRYSE